MKNSAWYYRIWDKKLNELPIKKGADASWVDMKEMLDLHVPVTHGGVDGIKTPKSIGSKIVSLLGYGLPAAAMIGGAAYLTLHVPAKHADPLLPKVTLNAGVKQNDRVLRSDGTLRIDSGLYAADIRFQGYKKEAELKVADAHAKLKNVKTAKSTKGLTSRGSSIMNTASSVNNRGRQVKLHPTARKVRAAIVRQHFVNNSSVRKGFFIENKNFNSKELPQNYLSKLSMNEDREKSEDIFNSIKVGPALSYPGNRKDNIKLSKKEIRKLRSKRKLRIKQLSKDKTSSITKKDKDAKQHSAAKSKTVKDRTKTPLALNYGFNGGLNVFSGGSGFYFGIVGDYLISNHFTIGTGLRINSARTISESYEHPSFYVRDSVPAYYVSDTRKLFILDIPVLLSYKVTKFISVKGGPILSIIKQSKGSTKFTGFVNQRDTTYKGVIVDESVPNSTVNKIGLGFSAGIDLHFKKFSLEAGYQMQTPFKVKNELGNYQKSGNTFRLGVGYRFL